MNKQWIYGSCFSIKSFKEACRITSMKMSDNVKQGYRFGEDKSGVLLHITNMPIAYYDIPTANDVVFPKKTWELVHEQLIPIFAAGAHWGESGHTDEFEVNIDRIAIRVNDFDFYKDNLIIGDVDVMDTVFGRNVYSCMLTGSIGLSQRGYGVLNDIGNGLKEVVPEEYEHVCWDAVTVPAVPVAMATGDPSKLQSKRIKLTDDFELVI